MVFAEQRQGKLMNVALELVGEGHKLSREISEDTKVCAILAGDKVEHLAEELYAYGADRVYLLEDELLASYTTDGYAKVMTDAINEYKPEIVLFGATHIGRDLAPRVAARLNTGLTADCTRLDISVANYMDYLEANTTANLNGLDREDQSKGLKQTRPAFGGNLMATHRNAEYPSADGHGQTGRHGKRREKGRGRGRTDQSRRASEAGRHSCGSDGSGQSG